MTEQEINQRKSRIYELKDEIRERENTISKIEDEIRSHYIAEAESKFPNIKRGDKVIVTHQTWTHKGYVTEKTEPVFFAYARYNKFAYELNGSRIEFVFKFPKKNGEPSQKEISYCTGSVVEMEKVNE